ncbi:hypothetical protein DC498_23920 [Terrimonas sp.]|uniref:DUF2911 domain-containing protein n=1 Tax=Terrimonas sp. TaxID=1914338 RepID=UPI000D50DC96|nr:DUF2911 domain-containing protein [Terrimonas sp.]PVD49678.1 hypothetical protein DC498_23920 [Terrimonas sp.]
MMYPQIKACISFAIACCIFLNSCHSDNKAVQLADTTAKTPPPIRYEPIAAVSSLDKSPMDVIYFPPEYPKLKMLDSIKTPPVFRIFYSRPQRSGRKIFGNVVKYGEHWRLGANEATEIEFFEDVYIQQTKIPAGRYILYCIPQPAEWTIVINKDLYSWGLKIDTNKDIFKFTVPTIKTEKPIEEFTIDATQSGAGADLWIGWDDTKIVLPVEIRNPRP